MPCPWLPSGAYARGARGSLPQWLHDSPQVSGEAILSAENSGKPLGGRSSVPNPAGRAPSAPPDPIVCWEGLAAPPE